MRTEAEYASANFSRHLVAVPRSAARLAYRRMGDAENARHEIAGHENARNAIVWNTACCICLSTAEQECMSRQERAPDFAVIKVQSSHDVDFQQLTFCLHLHKLCCQLCCQLCCTDYIFIIRFYSAYICHLEIKKQQAERYACT